MVRELNRRHLEFVDMIEAAGDRGIMTSVLLDWTYGGLKQPPTARKALHVRICRINKRLKPAGQKIEATLDGNRDGFYRLVQLRTPDADPQVQFVYRRPKNASVVRSRS